MTCFETNRNTQFTSKCMYQHSSSNSRTHNMA